MIQAEDEDDPLPVMCDQDIELTAADEAITLPPPHTGLDQQSVSASDDGEHVAAIAAKKADEPTLLLSDDPAPIPLAGQIAAMEVEKAKADKPPLLMLLEDDAAPVPPVQHQALAIEAKKSDNPTLLLSKDITAPIPLAGQIAAMEVEKAKTDKPALLSLLEDDAAPVPLIQQISVAVEKSDKPTLSGGVGPPLPVNSGDFEDDHKVNTDLGQVHDSDAPYSPPDIEATEMLPIMQSNVSQQTATPSVHQTNNVQDSITNSIEAAEMFPTMQSYASPQIARPNERQTSGEENQNHQVHEGGGNVDNETLIEAYLVEEGRESLDVGVAVCDTMVTVVPPEIGWSKRWLIILMSVICMMFVLMAALLAVYLHESRSTAPSSAYGESTSKPSTDNKNEDLMLAKNSTPEPTLSQSESPSLSPSAFPSFPKHCFQSKAELEVAVKLYIEQDCTTNIACSAGKTYGWPIGMWCVSQVTDMSGLFQDADKFNEDLWWDVSAVTDMSWMFNGAKEFNGDISSWNTSSLTSMQGMFYNASSFNGDIDSWDVSSVVNMEVTLSRAISFNQNLNNWDVSSVNNMFHMFSHTTLFNGDITSWNTSSVTTMTCMFLGATSFNKEIGQWDLSSVGLSSVGGTNQMFFGAHKFNADISLWDVSNVWTMDGMFYDAKAFDQNIGLWNVSRVAYMHDMFGYATSFNQDLSLWDTSSLTLADNMFYYASTFNQSICAWGDNFPYNNATDIFVGSGCTFPENPEIEQQGPFCASDCN